MGAMMVTALWVVPASPALALSCAPVEMVDLITGASTTGVEGVVEYQVIAENRTSFGKSVAASTRIWGQVQVDRWYVSASRNDCPAAPTRSFGHRWYVLVGLESQAGGPVFGLPGGGEISDLESAALAAVLAEPVVIAVERPAEMMAYLRVNWWGAMWVVLIPLSFVAVFLRRRNGARRDYLF